MQKKMYSAPVLSDVQSGLTVRGEDIPVYYGDEVIFVNNKAADDHASPAIPGGDPDIGLIP